MITVKAASDVAADATLSVTVGSSAGQITDGDSNTTITVNDSSTINVTESSVSSRGDTYTIVDATGGTLTVAPATLNITGESGGRSDFVASKAGETLVLTATEVEVDTSGSGSGVDDNVDTALAGDTTLLNALNGLSTTAEVEAAYKTLEPEGISSIASSSISLVNEVLSTVDSRISTWSGGQADKGVSSGDEALKKGVWAQIFRADTDQDDKDGYNGYEADTTGISIGGDIEFEQVFGDKTLLGIVYSFGETDINTNNTRSRVDVDSHQVGVYGSVEAENHSFNSMISYGMNHYDSDRNVVVGAVTRTALSKYEGKQLSVAGEYGYKYYLNDKTFIKPIIGFQYVDLNVDSYTESGAGGANLTVKDSDYSSFFGDVGLVFSAEKEWDVYKLIWELRAKYIYDLKNDPAETSSAFSSGGNYFKTTGMKTDRNSASLGWGVKIVKRGNFEIAINYELGLRDGFISHSEFISFRYRF